VSPFHFFTVPEPVMSLPNHAFVAIKNTHCHKGNAAEKSICQFVFALTERQILLQKNVKKTTQKNTALHLIGLYK
jgi:hypothetical protein